MSKKHPKLRLSRLRDIGWTLWDPIGLMPSGQKWDDPDNLNWADEYDSYLIWAAGALRRGDDPTEVAARLQNAVVDAMGLDARPGDVAHAKSVVDAILGDDQLWNSGD